MMKNTAHGLALAGVMTIGTLAGAGPVPEKRVDGESNWLVHLDLEEALGCDLGRMLLEKIEEGIDEDPDVAELLGDLELGRDVHGVTLYGWDGMHDDESMVIIISGTAALDRIGQKLGAWHEAMNGDVEIRVAGHDVWRVGEDDEVIHALTIETGDDERVMLASPGMGWLDKGLQVIDGKRAGMTGDAIERAAGGRHDGVILSVLASDVPGLIGFAPVSEIAQKAEALYLAVGQDGDDAFGVLALTTENGDEADSIVDIGQGLLALGRMIARESDDDDFRALLELTRGIRLESDGRTVRCSLRVASEKMSEMLGEVRIGG